MQTGLLAALLHGQLDIVRPHAQQMNTSNVKQKLTAKQLVFNGTIPWNMAHHRMYSKKPVGVVNPVRC